MPRAGSIPAVTLLKAGPKAPATLAADLRRIADQVERDEVTALVAAMVRGNEYEFVYGASVRDSLELSTLLQYRCLRRYET